ncbi:MAG TPA: outer membrane beta-barrel protein [Vicinamibacterales bacterium]|nr:outer membrane beta-barrel protein [Vicinamibacterales bacterium]
MRKLMLLGAALLVWPAAAHAQSGNNDIQGFGGLTVGTSTFGSAASPTFGGRVGVGLTDHIQLVGEAGRLADISSPLFDLLDFTDVGVSVSAFYGEGGVRFIASPHSAVRPYAEATAGFARLNAGISGIGGTAGAVVNTALNALNRTEPMLGAGAGVVLQGGPVSVDFGYRYKQISSGNAITSALNAGNPYKVNQVRVGIGFRF